MLLISGFYLVRVTCLSDLSPNSGHFLAVKEFPYYRCLLEKNNGASAFVEGYQMNLREAVFTSLFLIIGTDFCKKLH